MAHHHHHHHPAHATRRGFLRVLIPGSVFATRALAQQPADQAESFRRRSEEFEAKGLAEPFKGLTANGEVAPGWKLSEYDSLMLRMFSPSPEAFRARKVDLA